MGVSEIGVPFLGSPFKGILFYVGVENRYPYFGKDPYLPEDTSARAFEYGWRTDQIGETKLMEDPSP